MFLIISNLLIKLILFIIFLISSYNYGSILNYIFFYNESNNFSQSFNIYLNFASGLFTFSTLIFLCFALQIAYPISFIFVLFLPFLLYFFINKKIIFFNFTTFKLLYNNLLCNNLSFTYKIINYLILVIFILILIFSTLPQYAWDAMAYQLEIPKRYIQNHGLYFIDDIHFAGHPKLINMLYAFFMMFNFDNLTGTIHTIFLILTILIIKNFDFTNYFDNHFSKNLSILSSFLLLTHPQIIILSSWAYVDLGLMFYFLLAVLCFISNNLKLSAFYIGAAISVKYTGLIIAIGFLISYLINFKIKIKEKLKTILKLIVISIITFSPYMISNFYFTLNPFYPFLDYLIPFKTITYPYIDIYTATVNKVGINNSLLDKLLYPYYSMLYSNVHGNMYYDGLMGMTFFIFFPFFIIAIFYVNLKNDLINIRFFINSLGIIFIVYYLFVLNAQSTRFLIPSLPIFYIVSIYGLKISISRLIKNRYWLKVLLINGFIIFLIINVIPGFKFLDSLKPYYYLIGKETKENFLERNLAPYACLKEFEKILEKNKSVNLMSIYEPRLYYLKSNYIWKDVFEQSKLEVTINKCYNNETTINKDKVLENVLHILKQNQITHIIIKDKAFKVAMNNFNDNKKANIFLEFFNKKTQNIFSKNSFNLYEIIY